MTKSLIYGYILDLRKKHRIIKIIDFVGLLDVYLHLYNRRVE